MLAIDVGDKSSESSQLMEEYNVSGFPTVVLVENTGSGKKLKFMKEMRQNIFRNIRKSKFIIFTLILGVKIKY